MFNEIDFYDICHSPDRVNVVLTDNAHHLSNQLYLLTVGNNVKLDTDTLKALDSLKKSLEKVLDKTPRI